MEDLVVQILETLIGAAKYYEYSVRQSFDILKNVDKNVLQNLKETSPKVAELLKEFDIIYKRINEEI